MDEEKLKEIAQRVQTFTTRASEIMEDGKVISRGTIKAMWTLNPHTLTALDIIQHEDPDILFIASSPERIGERYYERIVQVYFHCRDNPIVLPLHDLDEVLGMFSLNGDIELVDPPYDEEIQGYTYARAAFKKFTVVSEYDDMAVDVGYIVGGL